MTQEPTYQAQAPSSQLPAEQMTRRINLGRLWAGGLATAIVTALIVVVGILVARQVLGTPALSSGTTAARYANTSSTVYALLAAAAALASTVLMNLLLLAVPQPARFFSWIAALVTVAAVILPFTAVGPTGPKVATALINLLVGGAIAILLSSIAAGCIRRTQAQVGLVPPTNI